MKAIHVKCDEQQIIEIHDEQPADSPSANENINLIVNHAITLPSLNENINPILIHHNNWKLVKGVRKQAIQLNHFPADDQLYQNEILTVTNQ